MKNIFESSISNEYVGRVNQLNANSERLWGKMNVAQMLAHCNVTYELIYENKHDTPGAIKKFILKLFVKNSVVNEKAYSKNGRTAPEFIKTEKYVFEEEQLRLIALIKKTQELGEGHFQDKESNSFGPLNSDEWNNMFTKHLDHHLGQFGV